MGLLKNSLTYGYNFNITATGPIDSRMRVEYIDDLTNTSTWNIEGKGARVYDGMLVVVLYKGSKGTVPCGDVWVLPDSDKYNVFDDGTPLKTGGWKLAGGISYSPGSGITFTENSTGGYDINANLCAGSGITLTEGDNGCIKINNNIHPSSGITVYVNEDDNGYVIASNLCAGSGITIEDGDDGCLKINSNIQAGSGLTITEGDDGELILDVNNQYCPGSGITFEDGEECDTINANTGLITIDDILCTQDAPIEALDIWSGDTIPSGTTLQEILIKLLCNILYPSNITLPSLANQSGGGVITKTIMFNDNISLLQQPIYWRIYNGAFLSNNPLYNLKRYTSDENGMVGGSKDTTYYQYYPSVCWKGFDENTNLTVNFTLNNTDTSLFTKTNFNGGMIRCTAHKDGFYYISNRQYADSIIYTEGDVSTNLTEIPIGRTDIKHTLKLNYSKPIVTVDGWDDKSGTTYDYGGWTTTSKPIKSIIKFAPRTNTNKYTLSKTKVSMDGSDTTAIWNSNIATNALYRYVYGYYPVYQNKNINGEFVEECKYLEKSDVSGNKIDTINNLTKSNNSNLLKIDFLEISGLTLDDIEITTKKNGTTNKYDKTNINGRFTLDTTGNITHVFRGDEEKYYRISQIDNTLDYSEISVTFLNGYKLVNSPVFSNVKRNLTEIPEMEVPINDYHSYSKNSNNIITEYNLLNNNNVNYYNNYNTYVYLKPASEAEFNSHFKFDFPCYMNTSGNEIDTINHGILDIYGFDENSRLFKKINKDDDIYVINKLTDTRLIDGKEYHYCRLEFVGNAYNDYKEFKIYFNNRLWMYGNNRKSK